jgi:hypothetical protein
MNNRRRHRRRTQKRALAYLKAMRDFEIELDLKPIAGLPSISWARFIIYYTERTYNVTGIRVR